MQQKNLGRASSSPAAPETCWKHPRLIQNQHIPRLDIVDEVLKATM
jgi:hypothetical protein